MKQWFGYMLILFSCLLWACETPISMKLPGKENTKIIEGWIENDKNPIVIVSNSISYYSTIGIEEILSAVDRDAKVYVTDEVGNTEQLTLGVSFEHIYGVLGAAYVGQTLKGEAGKEYTLYVEDKDGRVFTAKTRIPQQEILIDSIFFPINNGLYDTTCPIRMMFQDRPETYDCYRFFCKIKNLDITYSPVRLGTFDDLTFNGKPITYELSRAPLSNFNFSDMTDSVREDYSRSYFKAGDTIVLRSTLTDTATLKYWFPLQVDIFLGMNPFMVSGTYPTNIIGENVTGIWSGYHARYDTLIFPIDTLLH